jgi:ESCRT-II complex subunit VPS36
VLTIVVRGKGDCDAFLGKFWESWRGRAWESEVAGPVRGEDPGPGSVSGSGSGFYTREGAVRMVGVAGILRKEQEMWESTDKSLQDAFQDLNALMVMSVCVCVFLCLCLWFLCLS